MVSEVMKVGIKKTLEDIGRKKKKSQFFFI